MAQSASINIVLNFSSLLAKRGRYCFFWKEDILPFAFTLRSFIMNDMNPTFSVSDICSEFKRSIRLAVALIVSELISVLSISIAIIMTENLGKEYLAANKLMWGFFIIVIVFFIRIFYSVSIMVSQSFGAKDDLGISICFKQGLIMAIICALPMMLIMWLAPIILIWAGQDPVIIKLANPLFQSLIWAMLPLNITFVIEQFLIGIGKTRMVMLLNILLVLIQVFFYYAFLLDRFDLPKFGIAGIGYDLTASYCLLIIFFFYYLRFSKQLKPYRLFHKWWVVNRKFLFELIRVGLQLGLALGIEFCLLVATIAIILFFSTTALETHKIACQYFGSALFFLIALMQTMAIRVSSEVGRNNRSALKLAAAVNMGISFVFMLLFIVFYIHIAISSGIVDIHTPHLQKLTQKDSILLPIVGVLILADCLLLTSSGALRGLKDIIAPMFISIFWLLCIALPCVSLLVFGLNFGDTGIWCGLMISQFITGIILFRRFNRMTKHIDSASLVTKSE